MFSRTLFFCLVVSISLSFGFARAATLPAGFSETLFAGGLNAPTAMDFAPDGRLFVCQQSGELRVVKNGTLLSAPFLTLNVDDTGERGLLGVAFDPQFASNNFIYVYYTTASQPHNRVSRFTANGDVVLPGSEVPILDLEPLGATNHNGGAIHFGPDGMLYVAVGENAHPPNAQTLGNRLGKILRINRDGSIPPDNPFFNAATGPSRAIWALGLRNPFTFDFHRTTGRMFINDVGGSSFEEINDGIRGANYGWPNCEGACSPTNPAFRDPLFFYGHGNGPTTGNAITGGAFYDEAPQFPAIYQNKYFFADLSSGWIRVFDPSNNTASPFASGIFLPVDLKVGTDGSLYYLSRGNGSVFRIRFAATGTFSLSGRVSNASGQAMPNVGVALSPSVTGVTSPVLTNSAGYYTFNRVPSGTYTVTPTRSGVTFTPSSRNVTIGGANVSGQNFIGNTGFTLSGRVANSSGVAVPNVSVRRTGSSTAAITNSAGYYTFTNVPGSATYTLTPSLSGRTFTPTSRTVTVGSSNISGLNFTANSGFTISGRIATSNGTAIPNVSVTRTGSTTPAITNSAGYFTFNNVPAGTGYVLRPSRSGYTFSPTTRTVNVAGNVSGQNFIGTGP